MGSASGATRTAAARPGLDVGEYLDRVYAGLLWMTANPNPQVSGAYAGTEAGGDWTGQINLLGDRLDQPLRWRKPRHIFVNALSDLFHKGVPDRFIAKVWAVMALAPQHTFQILTKRHGRMRALLNSEHFKDQVAVEMAGTLNLSPRDRLDLHWPRRNVWLGVSVEDQERADLRIPALLDTPAAVRFLSCEPLLGPVDLTLLPWENEHGHAECVDWVIVGGESGPGSRPMHPDWARSLRDQCTTASVPFLFKQWGDWCPEDQSPENTVVPARFQRDDRTGGIYFGKRTAGRQLDGRTWDEHPGGES